MKIILPGIAMIAVVYAFARFSFGLFLPNITSSIGITESQAGIASSAAYFSYTLALLFSSLSLKEFGQLHVIQFAGLSAVIGLVGIAFSYNFYVLLMSTFIAGIGSGLASPAFSQVATTAFTGPIKDRTNTWINSGTSFGLVLSGPIALLFTEQWRFAFILFAILAFAVLLWNTFSIPKTATTSKTSTQSLFKWSTLTKAKHLIIASIIIGLGTAIYWTFSRSFLIAEHQMTTNESILFWITMGAFGVVGGIGGMFIDKLGLAFIYRLTLLALSLAIAILALPSTIAIYSSAIGFGITYILITGILIVWSTRLFSVAAVGVSLAFLSLGIGQSIGSAVAGELIVQSSYTMSFLLFALITFTGLLVPIRRSLAS
ncbi:MFS transporter [Geomicrobium sediminis]|uniref:MFS family arabinose efflux permease n=1 Tax=Geomicrobium sediminis TaxID=1347788 RepID=A0ABS2PEJ2_9BACL|nr:MFS transporter [Geomicrobium sediminis]MBM7633396.1 putative MFS family arabinose efflux permease [Geomicrobium sediminis]